MTKKMVQAQGVLRDALKRINTLGYSARVFSREFDFDVYREGIELSADHVDAEYGERFNVVLVPLQSGRTWSG